MVSNSTRETLWAPPFEAPEVVIYRRIAQAHDSELLSHLDRVAFATGSFAAHMKFDRHKQRFMAMAGFMHDIGKSFIPLTILKKPGRLTDEEMAVMRNHVDIGVQMVNHLPDSEILRRIIGEHHERPDGSGYPRGLSACDLLLESKMLSVADAYCAMMECRPYRNLSCPVDPGMELLASAGTQFDADLAREFVAMIANGSLFF